MKKARKLALSALVLAMATTACDSMYADGVAYPEALLIHGTVTKDGQPYTGKSFYFTMTAYFPNLGNNVTFNAGGQTDAKGEFLLEVTALLCQARSDWSVVSETFSSTDYSTGLILPQGPTAGRSETYETTSTTIPRSVCDGFFEGKMSNVAFAIQSEAKEFTGPYRRMNFEKSDWNKDFDEIDHGPKILAGVAREIVPIEMGLITRDKSESISGSLLTSTIELSDAVNRRLTKSSALNEEKTSWSYYLRTKKYTITTEAKFDFSAPSEALGNFNQVAE